MVHLRPLPASSICWKCQWQMLNQSRRLAQSGRLAPTAVCYAPAARNPSRHVRRTLHVSHRNRQIDPAPRPSASAAEPLGLPLRERLLQWQKEFGGPDEVALSAFANHPIHGDISNNMSNLSYSSKADEALDPTNDVRHEVEPGEEMDDGDDPVTIGVFLTPGDVVELDAAGHEPVLAVFVQQQGQHSQFFSVNGRWCHAHLHHISYAIPGCVDPALIRPIMPYMPTDIDKLDYKSVLQVPREHGAVVQAKLRELAQESEKIYRVNAPILDTAYSVLADATRARMMTLTQIAKALLSQGSPTWSPSPAALLAVRKALLQDEFRFRADIRTHRVTNVFSIRPKSDVEVMETVHQWIREYNEFVASQVSVTPSKAPSPGATHMSNFIAKSRRLIAVSRQEREPLLGGVGPSKTQPPSLRTVFGEYFTYADKKIIEFFQAWTLSGQFLRKPTFHSACTSVLHAIGLYEDIDPDGSVKKGTGYLFLQEIGVVSPHDNRTIYDEQLMLPTARLSRNLELLNARVKLVEKQPDFHDSMAKFRHDWGATTVYCIDSADAQEIDDGMSIERIPEHPSHFWVHVHIANPTAFFDKTHVLSGLAAHMSASFYIPERTFPMLPKWATQDFFSLGRNRPVITFSSRVNGAGTVLETKIQHGVIRNVLSLTPSELSANLGEKPPGKLSSFVVGSSAPLPKPVRPTPSLNSAQLQDLQDLYMVAKALWSSRKTTGAVRFKTWGGYGHERVGLWENANSPGLTWMPPSVEQARFVYGDPIIEVPIRKASTISSLDEFDSSSIVEEVMILACTSAASWCADRAVPVMFRGTAEAAQQGMGPQQFKEEVLEPYIQQHGGLSQDIASAYLRSFGRTVVHSSPIPHKSLGVPMYSKVTSPLRRFSDMLSHWQIEAAIRYESNAGRKLNAAALASASRPILPFSRQQIDEAIITLSPRERLLRVNSEYAARHWVINAFRRSLGEENAPKRDVFKAVVTHVSQIGGPSLGQTSDESIEVRFKDVPSFEYVIGNEYIVKVHSVDTFSRSIWVTPLELVSRMGGGSA